MITTNYKKSTKPDENGAKPRGTSGLGNITNKSANVAKTHQHRYKLLDTAQKYLREYRVSSCQRVPVGYAKNNDFHDFDVNIGTTDDGYAKFGGLSYCGNVWQCPCCASAIAFQRSREVYHAMAENAKRGGQAVFLTLTQPHRSKDALKPLIERQQSAVSKCFANGSIKRFLKSHGYLGQIRAFEITHGDLNGWHPHLHIILLFDGISINKAENIEEMRSLFYKFWSQWIVSQGGLMPSFEHGVDVRLPRRGDTEEIAAYIAKWGMEVTATHTKEGKNGSRTPFQILDDIAHGDYDWKEVNLLREYADATHKRRRIFWSKGLKNLFDVEEKTDEELADTPVKEVRFTLKWPEFKIIRAAGLCGELLSIATTYSESMTQQWVRYVCDVYQQAQKDLQRQSIKEKARLRKWVSEQTALACEELGILLP